ncbi:MAG: FecR family protein [Deltaproteobacteria bacterium]|nr:FecR family protein [Deltaproteobacteria bacterium]
MGRIILIIAVLFAVVGYCSVSYAAGPAGHVAALKGKVTIKRGKVVREAALNDAVYVNDKIETFGTSRVKLLMKDDSVLTLQPDSTMVINEFSMRKDRKRGRSMVSLFEGRLRSLVSKSQAGSFRVNTPTAVVGVKGTYFSVWVGTDAGRLFTGVGLHEGAVTVENIDRKVKGEVSLKQNQMTLVYEKEPPRKPTTIPEERKDELLSCQPE